MGSKATDWIWWNAVIPFSYGNGSCSWCWSTRGFWRSTICYCVSLGMRGMFRTVSDLYLHFQLKACFILHFLGSVSFAGTGSSIIATFPDDFSNSSFVFVFVKGILPLSFLILFWEIGLKY